jgi:signal transduction histidine kinase
MNRNRPSCLFVWRRKPGDCFAEQVALLDKAGVATVDMPLDADVSAAALRKKIPARCIAVVLNDTEAGWLRLAVGKIREAFAKTVPAPLFWIGDTQRAPGLVAESGLDDFFDMGDRPEAVAQRIELRGREAAARTQNLDQIKQQAAELVKSETALKQREEFLSVCAHDLRSPLGLIQSSLSLVLRGDTASGSLTPMQEELLGRAHRQAGHALTLVGDLLDVMSFEQGLKPHYQLLNLHQFLGEFYKDYRFQSEQKQVAFHYDNLIPQWRILGDAERVRQLLQNLFTNALKFTETGKNIYLNVSPFRGRRKTDPPYPMIIISVKDEGRGIPETEMRRIFDRFTQVKKFARGEGRGLGLTVAKQISNLHDGNLWVQSIEGKGSTFFVLFPHAVSRLEAPESPVPSVLIAEPSEARRKQFFDKLSGWGYEVHFARDGVEAVALLYHHWPSALVLTPELAKISAAEVSNLLKADALGSRIPLIGAGEFLPHGQPGSDSMLLDAQLPLPFTRTQWDRAVTEITQRQLSRPLRKSAA